jgi:hypothetical protein
MTENSGMPGIRKETETINDTSVRVQAVPVDDNGL